MLQELGSSASSKGMSWIGARWDRKVDPECSIETNYRSVHCWRSVNASDSGDTSISLRLHSRTPSATCKVAHLSSDDFNRSC